RYSKAKWPPGYDMTNAITILDGVCSGVNRGLAELAMFLRCDSASVTFCDHEPSFQLSSKNAANARPRKKAARTRTTAGQSIFIVKPLKRDAERAKERAFSI